MCVCVCVSSNLNRLADEQFPLLSPACSSTVDCPLVDKLADCSTGQHRLSAIVRRGGEDSENEEVDDLGRTYE